MPTRIRICYQKMIGLIEENAQGSFSGELSLTRNLFLEAAARRLNRSFVQHSTSGKLVNKTTGDFNGCIGSLQRNESDFCVSDPAWPIQGSGVQLITISDRRVTSMLSAYDNQVS